MGLQVSFLSAFQLAVQDQGVTVTTPQPSENFLHGQYFECVRFLGGGGARNFVQLLCMRLVLLVVAATTPQMSTENSEVRRIEENN
jgi:hypothetical protein